MLCLPIFTMNIFCLCDKCTSDLTVDDDYIYTDGSFGYYLNNQVIWEYNVKATLFQRSGRQSIPGEHFMWNFTFIGFSAKNEEQENVFKTGWIIDKSAIWRCK